MLEEPLHEGIYTRSLTRSLDWDHSSVHRTSHSREPERVQASPKTTDPLGRISAPGLDQPSICYLIKLSHNSTASRESRSHDFGHLQVHILRILIAARPPSSYCRDSSHQAHPPEEVLRWCLASKYPSSLQGHGLALRVLPAAQLPRRISALRRPSRPGLDSAASCSTFATSTSVRHPAPVRKTSSATSSLDLQPPHPPACASCYWCTLTLAVSRSFLSLNHLQLPTSPPILSQGDVSRTRGVPHLLSIQHIHGYYVKLHRSSDFANVCSEQANLNNSRFIAPCANRLATRTSRILYSDPTLRIHTQTLFNFGDSVSSSPLPKHYALQIPTRLIPFADGLRCINVCLFDTQRKRSLA